MERKTRWRTYRLSSPRSVRDSMGSGGRSGKPRSSYASWRRRESESESESESGRESGRESERERERERGRPMHLVERHVIKRADPRFTAIDAAAFASKNLYNAANYVVRHSFIRDGVTVT